jgi:hypothetical protein
MTDKEIARALNISDGVVNKHIQEAMKRLGVNTRKAALRALGSITPVVSDPIFPTSDFPTVLDVDADQAVDPRADADDPAPSLYGWYSRLGRWRTPPRSVGFRTWTILGWFLAGGIILVVGYALIMLIVGGTADFAPTSLQS